MSRLSSILWFRVAGLACSLLGRSVLKKTEDKGADCLGFAQRLTGVHCAFQSGWSDGRAVVLTYLLLTRDSTCSIVAFSHQNRSSHAVHAVRFHFELLLGNVPFRSGHPLLFHQAVQPSLSTTLISVVLQLGYELDPKDLEDVFERFKGLADKKKVRMPPAPAFHCLLRVSFACPQRVKAASQSRSLFSAIVRQCVYRFSCLGVPTDIV